MLQLLDDKLGSGDILVHTTKIWVGFSIPGPSLRHLAIWGPKDGADRFTRVQAKIVSKPIDGVVQTKLREGYSQAPSRKWTSMVNQYLTGNLAKNLQDSSAVETLLAEWNASPGTVWVPLEIDQPFTSDFQRETVPW